MRTKDIQALLALQRGETVPKSDFREILVAELIADGGVSSIIHGSRHSLKVVSPIAFELFLNSKGLCPGKLEETLDIRNTPDSRARQVQLTGNSKAFPVRTCPGFPVNVTAPLCVCLGSRKILLSPCPGTFLYISDFHHFRIPPDVIVVGVENMENFRLPERQSELLAQIGRREDDDRLSARLLLVSRYPQSKDLVSWLQEIPNPYVHFGDFDLAGIHIFLSEFYAHLGPDRASFFVPDDIEARLRDSGSRDRYTTQFPRFGKMALSDARLQPLADLIHQYQKGYDQEGYIEEE